MLRERPPVVVCGAGLTALILAIGSGWLLAVLIQAVTR